MKKILIIPLIIVCLNACTDDSVEKVLPPYYQVAGEYVVDLNLTQPFEFHDMQHIRIYNASFSDSLWIEDEDFFESKVKVKWNGDNTFGITEGVDILHGEIVNISGTVYPEKDSVYIEWRYLQGGEPDEDFVVKASGLRYNGLSN